MLSRPYRARLARLIGFAGALSMLSVPASILNAAQVAPDAQPLTIMHLVSEADLVIRGHVIDIRFRMSDGDPETYSRVPHTWVTYRIEETFRGSYDNASITLRFMGGATGMDGRVMRISGMPLFATGNVDLLFIKNNGTSSCPLVACAAGRYRIHDDQLFSDNGRTVRLAEFGRVVPGSRVLGEDIVKMVIPPAPDAFIAEERARMADVTDARERARAERYLASIVAERVLSIRTVEPTDRRPDDGLSVSLSAFVSALRSALGEAPPPTQVLDAPFDTPVFVSRPEPRPFAIRRLPQAAPPQVTRERALYERANRNPVLTPR